MLTSQNPIFAVSSVTETIRYYKDVLGFTDSWTWGMPTTFGSASFGEVRIMFGQNPELAKRIHGHTHWLYCDYVNAMHELRQANGAKIVSPIDNKPWGSREYTVEDINGYHLRFAGDVEHKSKSDGVFPDDVRIVESRMTLEIYRSIAGREFYKNGFPSDILEKAHIMFLAIAPDGTPIGTTRLMFDAPGWYSIWDVAVLPEWQEKGLAPPWFRPRWTLLRPRPPVHGCTFSPTPTSSMLD